MVDTGKHDTGGDYSAGSVGAHLRTVKAWLSRARGSHSDTTQQRGDWKTKGGSGWQSSTGVSYNPDTFDLVDGKPVRDTFETFKNADGEWDPKRLDIHAGIVRKYTADVPKSAHPTVYFLGGGPASGVALSHLCIGFWPFEPESLYSCCKKRLHKICFGREAKLQYRKFLRS